MAIGVLTGQMRRPSVRPNRPSADCAPVFVWALREGWRRGGSAAATWRANKRSSPQKGGHKICVSEKLVKMP